MSAIARPKKISRKISSLKATEAKAPRMPRPSEAPDRGDDQAAREAPESGRVRIAEAPDAGEGRQALWDHDATHGRSQS